MELQSFIPKQTRLWRFSDTADVFTTDWQAADDTLYPEKSLKLGSVTDWRILHTAYLPF